MIFYLSTHTRDVKKPQKTIVYKNVTLFRTSYKFGVEAKPTKVVIIPYAKLQPNLKK